MVKIKLRLYLQLSHTGGLEVQFHSFLSSELDIRKRSTSRRICFTPEISSWYSWVGTQLVRIHLKSLPIPEIESRFFGRAAGGQVTVIIKLSRIRYKNTL